MQLDPRAGAIPHPHRFGCAGYFDSEMLKGITGKQQRRVGRTPLAPRIWAQAVANTICFPVSKKASFMTGRTPVVDGGVRC